MKLDLIISFDNAPQEFLTINEMTMEEISTREQTMEDLLHLFYELDFPPEKVRDIYKISCCLVECTEHELTNAPQWYLNCNGKLWREDIRRHVYAPKLNYN